VVKFQNGFQTMKVLTIPNRLKWMKTCAVLWGRVNQNFSQIRFEADNVKEGECLNDSLENIPPATINGFMEKVERKQAPEMGIPPGPLELMGLMFNFSAETSTLAVRKLDRSSKAIP
jgi:hypothetical protein